MARPIWTGSISFGLVNVPVKAFSAVRDHDVHFHAARDRFEPHLRLCPRERARDAPEIDHDTVRRHPPSIYAGACALRNAARGPTTWNFP